MKLGTGEVVDPRRQGAWSPCGYPSRPSTVLDRVRPNGLDPPLVGSAFGQVLDEHQTRHRARRHRRPTLDTPLPGIARGVRASRPGEIDPRCLGRGRGRSEPSRNTGRRQPDGRRYPRGPARVGNPLSACRLHPPFISSAAHQTRHGQRGGGAGRNGARHDRGLARDPPLPDVAGRVRSRLPGEVGSSRYGAGCGYGELGRRARSRQPRLSRYPWGPGTVADGAGTDSLHAELVGGSDREAHRRQRRSRPSRGGDGRLSLDTPLDDVARGVGTRRPGDDEPVTPSRGLAYREARWRPRSRDRGDGVYRPRPIAGGLGAGSGRSDLDRLLVGRSLAQPLDRVRGLRRRSGRIHTQSHPYPSHLVGIGSRCRLPGDVDRTSLRGRGGRCQARWLRRVHVERGLSGRSGPIAVGRQPIRATRLNPNIHDVTDREDEVSRDDRTSFDDDLPLRIPILLSDLPTDDVSFGVRHRLPLDFDTPIHGIRRLRPQVDRGCELHEVRGIDLCLPHRALAGADHGYDSHGILDPRGQARDLSARLRPRHGDALGRRGYGRIPSHQTVPPSLLKFWRVVQ